MNKISSTEEVINLPVTRYRVKFWRTDGGYPTCAIDFTCNKVCQFYMTKHFGTQEVCFFSENSDSSYTPLHRRDEPDAYGSLIPHSQCPIWRSENES